MRIAKILLDSDVAKLLVKTKKGVPEVPFLGSVATLNWGDLDLNAKRASIEFDGDKLCIRSENPFSVKLEREFDVAEDRQYPIHGCFVDGTRFRAKRCFCHSKNVSSDESGNLVLRFSLSAHGADVVRAGGGVRYWVGGLDVKWARLVGNLRVEVQRGGDGQNLLLKGAYTYYLVRIVDSEEDAFAFVIDCGVDELDVEVLDSDFLALQFSLGQPLRLSHLIGVDDFGSAVAWRGVGLGIKHGRDRRFLRRLPVPPSRFECFLTDLFARVSEALRKKPELRLYVAISYYLESLVEMHLDGAYLKLQVALETTAKRLLQGQPKSNGFIVRNKAEWDAWVEGKRDELRAFAMPGDEERFLGKIRSAAHRSSGGTVELAFRSHGISLDKEILKEIDRRNMVAHAALMSSPEDRNVVSDFRRINMIQSLLVMLVALGSGYRGSIVGWAGDGVDEAVNVPEELWRAVDFQEVIRFVATAEGRAEDA